MLSQPQYLNAPEIVVEQVITGRYADGLGNIKTAEDRVDYQPFPHYSAAVWLMTQLRRWNMLKEDIDYKKLAQQVMLATDAAKIMRDLGATPPAADFGKEIILGQELTPANRTSTSNRFASRHSQHATSSRAPLARVGGALHPVRRRLARPDRGRARRHERG